MVLKCAFCDLPRRMTREHIWPNGFLRRGDFGVKFSARAGRTFSGDLVVRDVCEVCNSGPLSRLDAYACELYDANFSRFPEHLEPVAFTYDYGKMSRWLLKVAFNSARAQGHSDAELLRPYRSAILASGDCSPILANVYLALVGPGTLSFSDGRPDRTIFPKAARSGPVVVPSVRGYQHVSTRMVMINGYFFTLVLSRTPTMPADEVVDLLRQIPGKPIALDGYMEMVTTMSANQALAGVREWPRGR